MKKSNKVLLGGIGFIILAAIVSMMIGKANIKVWSNADCHALPRATKTITDSFERVELSESILATLTQGDFKVDIDAPKESMNSIKHEIENGVLKIYIEDGEHAPCPINVNLRCPQLKGVKIYNGSQMSTVGIFETPNLDIDIMNGSSIDFDLKCDRVTSSARNSASMKFAGYIGQMEMSGSNSADIDALNAKVSNVKVNLTNSASALINADTISQANLSNSTSLRYSGETVLGQISTSNSSSINMIK